MLWTQIKKMPTTKGNIHESIFRSYSILEKVKEYLKRNVPPEIILEIIEEVEEFRL